MVLRDKAEQEPFRDLSVSIYEIAFWERPVKPDLYVDAESRSTKDMNQLALLLHCSFIFTFSSPVRGRGALQWHMLFSATCTPSLG